MIFGALERALRASFDERPESEADVQREIEKILRAVGIEFHREKDQATVGPTTFKPDFTVLECDLAIEVKLARRGLSAQTITRALAEDASGYGTRWSNILAVIYDVDGTIRDEAELREGCEAIGIRLLVVKH